MNLRTFYPPYLVRRIRQYRFEKSHPDVPWLTASGILLLESWLRPMDTGIEWGSGRSTSWIAARVGSLLSIEDHPEWHATVSRRLVEKGLSSKVDYRHITCSESERDEPDSHPYAAAAEHLPDGSVDFALVDGKIRLTCMRVAIRKIRPGGLLILDNANRYVPNPSLGGYATVHQPCAQPSTPKWAALLQQLQSWRWIMTSDGIWDTRFWVKPCD